MHGSLTTELSLNIDTCIRLLFRLVSGFPMTTRIGLVELAWEPLSGKRVGLLSPPPLTTLGGGEGEVTLVSSSLSLLLPGGGGNEGGGSLESALLFLEWEEEATLVSTLLSLHLHGRGGNEVGSQRAALSSLGGDRAAKSGSRGIGRPSPEGVCLAPCLPGT